MSENSVSLDKAFLKIFLNMESEARTCAAKSVEMILGVSSNFVSSDTMINLKEFYNLYFNDGKLAEKKDDINKEVDDIFEKAKELSEKGEQIESIKDAIDIDKTKETDRLGLSAIQKKLETIITLEEGLKEKVAPILSSMQFEDASRQRLEHITLGLTEIVAFLGTNFSDQVEKISREVADALSSDEEREVYYRLVLSEDPPKGLQERSVWLEF